MSGPPDTRLKRGKNTTSEHRKTNRELLADWVRTDKIMISLIATWPHVSRDGRESEILVKWASAARIPMIQNLETMRSLWSMGVCNRESGEVWEEVYRRIVPGPDG